MIPNYDLTPRNTFRMKVKCAAFLEIASEKELSDLFQASDIFSQEPVFGPERLPKPVMVMGGGSNLLFRGDFPGTVVHIGIKGIDRVGPTEENAVYYRLGAGVVFDEFCAWAAGCNLWGPENLSLIPGECGASAVQNIGAYGVEAKDIIHSVHAWDLLEGKWVDILGKDCGYGYRSSNFKSIWKGRYIITSVTYRLWTTPHPVLDYGGVRKELESRGVSTDVSAGEANASRGVDARVIVNGRGPLAGGIAPQERTPGRVGFAGASVLTPQLLRDTIIGIRRRKLPDPEEIGSAGSFFCNPVITREHFERIVETARQDNGPEYQVPHYDVGDMVKVPAAWMIEQCGFKGARNGGAQVFQNQPLVIVNASGEATPEEIIGLEKRIIDTIREKYGIVLHPEVEHI